MWYLYALASAIFVALASITEKKTLFKEHAMEFSTVLSIINFLLVLFLLPIVKFNVPLKLLLIIYLSSVLGCIGFLYATKALRHMDISTASPLMNISPAIVAILGFFFLSETLEYSKIGGIFFIVIGAYVLEVDHSLSNLKEPFIRMVRSKYVHYILFALLLYGITTILDRYILTHGVDPYTYIFIVHLFIMINFIFLISVFHDGFKGIKHGFKSAGKWIFLAAIFFVTSRIFLAQALSMAYVALVIPIRRLSTLFATIIGGSLFHEKGLPIKIIACVITLIGVGLMIL